jgi:hypothetical protein
MAEDVAVPMHDTPLPGGIREELGGKNAILNIELLKEQNMRGAITA